MDKLNLNYYILTEVINHLKAEDIKIHIYDIGVNDIELKHKENYEVLKKLKDLNSNQIIIFYERYIASFDEIKDFGDIKYITYEAKTIDCNLEFERVILERLILRDIYENVDSEKYRFTNSGIYSKTPLYKKNGLLVTRYYVFNINVEPNREIIIGFDFHNQLRHINNITSELNKGSLEEGTELKDYLESTYTFVRKADHTISEVSPYLGKSIKQYYIDKGDNILKDVSDDTPAVIVKNNKDEEFDYCPTLLYKVASLDSLDPYVRKEVNKYIKIESNERIRLMVSEGIGKILVNSKYAKASVQDVKLNRSNYKPTLIDSPSLKFGNGKQGTNINNGIKYNGVYQKADLNISYFIDLDLIGDKYKRCRSFTHNLENYSKQVGVNLNRISMGNQVEFKDIDVNDKNKFELAIREAARKYKEITIFIMTDKNIKRYYDVIKKAFGHDNKIPTQCINYNTISSCDKRNEQYIFSNILLGIYGKKGIKPWVLADNLISDCFIGLDISIDDKKFKLSAVNIIGPDGTVLKTKIMSKQQSGEKISSETLRDIIIEAIESYKHIYYEIPKHITFHRDGVCREDLDELKQTLDSYGIEFDYVEIIKNSNRRMAVFEKEDQGEDDKNNKEKKENPKKDKDNEIKGKYYTKSGLAYIKDKVAFITTTSPKPNMGMAQPLKIRHVYGNKSMKDILQDIYYLSYMHVGSTQKTRLPVTIHYADLGSLYSNKGLIPENIDDSSLHFL